MPKKIAIVFSGAKHRGGMETYLTNLFQYADGAKVEMNLFSLGKWDCMNAIEELGFPVKVFPGKRIRIRTIFEIAKELRVGKYALVVSQGVVANAYARAASILSGVPNLITVHSAFTHDYPNILIRFGYFTIDRILRWRTKKYITVSKFLKENLIKSGIKAEKVEIIYNGVDFKIPNIKYQIPNTKFTIGSIGRLHSVKNYENLIKAISILENKNIKLEIAGDGPERGVLEKKIAELGLINQIKLLGQVDDIGELFARWDLYVQPSFSEGFGLTVVEAMGAGLPVVVTPGGALLELVENEKTGFVTARFDPESISRAINKYIENPKLAESCAKNGQKSVKERFCIKTWADKTIDLYLEACRK